jgi:pimeloyl-ACP methyl ester carboxylesterase
MGQGNVDEFGAALEGEETLRPFLEAVGAAMAGAAPEEIRRELESVLSPVDFDVFSGEVAEFLASSLRAALGGGVDGWVDDDLAFVGDWGFEVTGPKVPTLVVQGAHDLMVPPAHYRWLEAHIPDADARFEPEEGHLTLYARFVPTVHDWLARFF